MSTPGLKFATKPIVCSQSSQASENILTGCTMADGSAVDFSTGWFFAGWVMSKQGFNTNYRNSVNSNLAITGGPNGELTLVDHGGFAAANWWASGATYVIIGTNDSGATNTVCYQGPLSFSF